MPTSADDYKMERVQAEQARRAASADLLNANEIWFKVLGMLQQHWAVCEPAAKACRVRFFRDDSMVFDRLEFTDATSAGVALRHNGFTRLRDRPSFMAVAPLPRFPLVDSADTLTPLYSAEKHWQTPPDGCEIRQPRRLSPIPITESLKRFVDAQDPVWFTVLEELIAEQKRTHWMWYVFPQHRSLGQSANAKYYGLDSLSESERYWDHHVLGPRLNLACTLMLAIEGKSAADVLGSVDAIKLHSCATLFGLAAARERVFAALITKYFNGQLCQRTIDALEEGDDTVRGSGGAGATAWT